MLFTQLTKIASGCSCKIIIKIKNSEMSHKILIAGVGNPFRHDDGIGPFIIATLKEQQLDNRCDLLDAGTDALSLLESIKSYARVLIIDAVNVGAGSAHFEPGSIQLFTPAEAKIKITADALSTHGFGLAEMLLLAEQLEIPTDISIIGIQPADISFGAGLSEVVAAKKDEIVKRVLEWVELR